MDTNPVDAHRAAARRIALWYIVAASAWIVVSDFALSFISWSAEATNGISIAKGVLFVAVTGALLYFVVVKTRVAGRDAGLATVDEHLRMLSQHANDIILMLDDTGRILNANERAFEAYGYPLGGIIGLPASRLRPAQSPGFDAAFQRILDEGSAIYETVHVRKDGNEFPVEISARRIDIDGGRYVQAIIRDISERKRAQREIEYKNLVLSTQQESSPDAILVVDENAKIVSYNRRFVDLLKIPKELVNAGEDEPVLQYAVSQMRDPEEFIARVRHLYEHREESSHEELVTKDGRFVERHSAPLIGANGRYYGRIWHFRDITERKKAEMELRDSEERFRAVLDQSIAGIYVIQDGRIAYINPRMREIFGYGPDDKVDPDPLAFVAPSDRAKVVEQMTHRLTDAPTAAYSIAALRKDGSPFTLGVNARQATYGGRPAIIAVAQDITEKAKSEQEIKRYIARLEQAMRSTIEVVSTIGELRDPYTHGHEHRVGEMAAAVAAEMGLGADRVEGIRVAGYLHDVGKIAVPAEILAKPARLSPAEFELVKSHAQQSYEILKGVEFPWPVAEAAWQHHERLDGSGYPRGLKGDDIILEARVLAVADTVEAMSSHRPYRPGLGIERALAEIEDKRGKLFDPQAVDACLRLFREKGYVLPA